MHPERWAAGSAIYLATSTELPIDSSLATIDVGWLWYGGFATPDNERTSPRVVPPGWQHTRSVQDGTTCRDSKQNALSDWNVSRTECDGHPARTVRSNEAQKEHEAPVVAASDGHLVRHRYRKNRWCDHDAVACYRASFCPAFRHHWRQTKFRNKLIRIRPDLASGDGLRED